MTLRDQVRYHGWRLRLLLADKLAGQRVPFARRMD
jgi:hypothetical protein